MNNNIEKGFSMPPSDIALDFDCIPVEVIDEEQEEQEREDEEDIVETWDGREADEDWVDTWLYRDGD